MSFSDSDLMDLIDLIYETALDFRKWPEALHQVSRAVNAKGALLLPSSERTVLLSSASRDLDDAKEPYAKEWWRHDYMTQLVAERGLTGIFTQASFSEQDYVDRHPFFQEFRRKYDMGGLISYAVDSGLQPALCIAIQLGYGKNFLSEAELQRCHILFRHLSRAVKIAVQLAGRFSPRAGLPEAMQSVTIGLAIVDASQTVLFANKRFENLHSRGLRILRGRLVAGQAGQQRALERMIADAIKNPSIPSSPHSIALRRAAPRPLLVRVIPLRFRGDENGFAALVERRLALVAAIDPDEILPSGEAALSALGLTAAEARVAGLIGAGLSPAEVAARLGNAQDTVRSLLKRVYSKVGVERQSQLAGIVARLTTLD